MTKKIISQPLFLTALILLTTSCGLVTLAPASTPIPPTETPVVEPLTIMPTYTLPPSLPAVLPKFSLDGYVMLFTKADDLYFQDGNNSPVNLAHVGNSAYIYFQGYYDNYYKISDDNQEVVFSRDDGSIYSIKPDGTQERVIISNDWLVSLGSGTRIGALNFIPGIHQLFIQTVLCKSQEFRSPCSTSIFLVDTDTGEIKKLADLGLTLLQNSTYRNVRVSPDGKMVAVGTMEGMDILTMDGKVIRHNILPYTPSTSKAPFPSLFWLPDSSGLFVALPDTLYDSPAFGPDYQGHTLWHYTLANNVIVRIPFNSSIPGYGQNSFDISSDGKWIVYGGISPNNNDADSGLYIGNLTNGHSQKFDNAYVFDFSWSPGNKYFIGTSSGSTIWGG